MNVRKFTAGTSREALRMVRDAIGPDAVILSNRSVNGAVEILALPGEDMSALSEPVAEKPTLSESTLAALSPRRHAQVDQAAELTKTMEAVRTTGIIEKEIERGPSVAAIGELMNEIRSMRGMLEAQLAEISWSSQQKREPAKSVVLREM